MKSKQKQKAHFADSVLAAYRHASPATRAAIVRRKLAAEAQSNPANVPVQMLYPRSAVPGSPSQTEMASSAPVQ